MLDFTFASELFTSWLAREMWSSDWLDYLSQLDDAQDSEHF